MNRELLDPDVAGEYMRERLVGDSIIDDLVDSGAGDSDAASEFDMDIFVNRRCKDGFRNRAFDTNEFDLDTCRGDGIVTEREGCDRW